ncbi:MAG: hypothetical protein AB8B77_00205 [Alphaproteobacteria bacterium]
MRHNRLKNAAFGCGMMAAAMLQSGCWMAGDSAPFPLQISNAKTSQDCTLYADRKAAREIMIYDDQDSTALSTMMATEDAKQRRDQIYRQCLSDLGLVFSTIGAQ